MEKKPARKRVSTSNRGVPASKELRILRHIIEITNSDLDLNMLLHNIVSLMADLTKADSCFLYLKDKDGPQLVLMASSNPHARIISKIKLNIGEGLTGWVAENRKIIMIPEKAFGDYRFKTFNSLPEDKYECFVAVPIVSPKNDLIGVINLQHKNKKRYTKATISMLSMIANLISGVIKHAKLYDEMQRKAEHLETIFKITYLLITSTELDDILYRIVEIVAQAIGSPICSIMLYDREKDVLEIAATQSLSGQYKKKGAIKMGEGISGKALQQKAPIVVKDVTKDGNYQFRDVARKEGLRSMASIPMIVRDDPIGVINTYRSQEIGFTDDELSLLTVIASLASIAIDNARLAIEAQKSRREVEVRKIVERAKGILMEENGFTEEQAYKWIHKKSMDSCRPMKETTEAILLYYEAKDKHA